MNNKITIQSLKIISVCVYTWKKEEDNNLEYVVNCQKIIGSPPTLLDNTFCKVYPLCG